MEIEAIKSYLNKYPEITYKGIEWNLNNTEYQKQRVELLDSTEEIQKCIFWLVEFYFPNQMLVNMHSSYVLKHYVENYFNKYVSNGSFVAAVKIMGFKYRAFTDDLNIYLSVNKFQFIKYMEKYFRH